MTVPSTLDTVAVVGNGLVGHGMAQIFAAAGHRVVMIGRREESLAAAMERIAKSLAAFEAHGLVTSGEISAALGLIRTSTDLKDAAEAQLVLGDMYHRGQGVAANDFEALGWYVRAGRQGVAEAQLGVARMYDAGEGIPQDFVTAYAWARIAADQDVPGAADLRDVLGALLTERERERGEAEAARLWEAYVVPFRD